MTLFTSAHTAKIAEIIANADRDDDGDVIGPGLIEDLMVMLLQDNPNFDSSQFEEQADIQKRFRNHYKCPAEDCGHEWIDEWTAQCDDDCPECGFRHISPYKSEDL